MGSFNTILSDWGTDEGPRSVLMNTTPDLVCRWLNQAQLRFCDKSEILQGVWEPVLDSSGSETLPDDFLREVPGRVKWEADHFLTKGDYPTLQGLTLSGVEHYAIWQGSFYVFSASSGTPAIPYIRKAETVKTANRATASLEIPTEYHHDLLLFMDAMYARRQGDDRRYLVFIGEFDARAVSAGVHHTMRREVPMMRGGLL